MEGGKQSGRQTVASPGTECSRELNPVQRFKQLGDMQVSTAHDTMEEGKNPCS